MMRLRIPPWTVMAAWTTVAAGQAGAAVVIEEELPALKQQRTTVLQGVRMREELHGPAGDSVSLILPDENRMLELFPASRVFEEKPLGAELAGLGAVQRAMARDVRLLGEEISVEKGAQDRVAGLACTRYRFTWKARVRMPDGPKNYAIHIASCISQAPAALAARKAMMRHVRAVTGRLGMVLQPEKGEVGLFDVGRMLLGVPARKLAAAQYRIGGFSLDDAMEIDFGGMPLEAVMRGVARQGVDGGETMPEQESGIDMGEIQQAMQRMQSPEFRAQMREAMKEMQDPEVQAQMRRFISPEQMRMMQKSMGEMAEHGLPDPGLAGGKLRIAHRVTAIRVVGDRPELTRPPADYAWKQPAFTTPESREADPHDGDGALSADDVRRLMDEARTGRRPAGADENYAPMPRSAGPWMAFYREWEGVPYRWGGETKRGVDCSALTKNAYHAVPRITIPRTTAEQIREGRRISLRDASPGDLVFFDTGFRHVGVYVGQNKFFHASSSKGVTLSSLANRYWSRTYRETRRIRR
ncbi:MAG: NlpC/P60 family protein [Mariprofundaceae bacterium]|nr:NlpC/P60 family protein [Mariprofundaceae bacterium]